MSIFSKRLTCRSLNNILSHKYEQHYRYSVDKVSKIRCNRFFTSECLSANFELTAFTIEILQHIMQRPYMGVHSLCRVCVLLYTYIYD